MSSKKTEPNSGPSRLPSSVSRLTPSLVPVILAGGSGTRLWPLSRQLYPKQFLALVGRETMLQDTVRRLAGLAGVGAPLVVCNDEHRFLAADQLREIHAGGTVVLEPVGRNTAPAVAVAALEAMADGSDPLLLVLPADHVIRDAASFRAAVAQGVPLAEAGSLITFGIVPTHAETGYGYIARGKKFNEAKTVYRVERFVEKPDRPTAEEYVSSGAYFWNSGMFLFRASVYLEELERFAPEMAAAARRAHAGRSADLGFVRLDAEAFAASPADSIDYAVMEKTERAAVVPLDCGWSDVGSWSALLEVAEADQDGNVLSGNVLGRELANCYVNAGHRMVAALGVRDLVVVETADAVLVAGRHRAQDVKLLVDALKREDRSETVHHRKVLRPWGSYETVDLAERFQVKRIVVKPGARLSSQLHHHRAEHWIVVRGTARVLNGDQEIILSENQSTYIPLGTMHRLENPGRIPLELIEVQSGSYLGEDDIVRFDDVYGRADGGQ